MEYGIEVLKSCLTQIISNRKKTSITYCTYRHRLDKKLAEEDFNSFIPLSYSETFASFPNGEDSFGATGKSEG